MNEIITVENVYKYYDMSPQLELRTLVQWAAQSLRRSNHQATGRIRYVLRNVSLSMEPGESVALIGNNGAGKTTLLRLLASVSLPSKGRIRVQGRVSSLISLGAGFHPELTGRENLFLTCALMGLGRRQTADRIDQIIDFAELGDYIDVAIKRYSSGMLARLGFSAALHVEPEIILIDEVLSVGDYRFQVKSLAALRDYISQGTVVFVSHDLGSVERICQRAIWLEQGEVRASGISTEVVRQYVEEQQRKLTSAPSPSTPEPPEESAQPERRNALVSRQAFDDKCAVVSVGVVLESGQPCAEFQIGQTITVRAELAFEQATKDVRVVIGLVDIETRAVITATDNQLIEQPDRFVGRTVVESRFPGIMLRPRGYGVYVGVSNPKALMPLYIWQDLETRFFVAGSRRDPAMHFFAPQADLLYTPGASMRYIEVNRKA